MTAQALDTPKDGHAELMAWLSQARSEIGKRFSLEVLQDVLGLDRAHTLRCLGEALHMPVMEYEALSTLKPDFSVWPFAKASECKSVIARDGEQLIGVVTDPLDEAFQLKLESRLGKAVRWCLCDVSIVEAYLARHEESMRAMVLNPEMPEGRLLARFDEQPVANISLASIEEDTSPVVRLVNSTIYDALKLGASDIHFESEMRGLTIKYRIDGVLSTATTAEGLAHADQVVSRLKVMAQLDIGERRVPQDGRFKLAVRGREVDFRVSVMPSLWGEDVVVRILDKHALTQNLPELTLDTLGFDAVTLEEVRAFAREPYGMLLVTGPTGSGKTTTLYAAVSEINTGSEKIVTIEDPIEYQLAGILQIPVNEKKGLTFAKGLRSILRHDPDKILVGEIRDTETAQIAIQSALTGHLVFTTVHANNVFDVIARFLHMGVDPYNFVASLNGILAQRLVRLNCGHCSVPIPTERFDLKAAGIVPAQLEGATLMRGTGCAQCRGSGYKGRAAIGEVLTLTDEVRELIVSRAPISELKRMARKNGTRLLREVAVALMLSGRTTLEEINRVSFAG